MKPYLSWKLTTISFLSFLVLSSFAFKEQGGQDKLNLKNTTWQLVTTDSDTGVLTFEKVVKLNRKKLGYCFKKSSKLRLVQIKSADYENIIRSKITPGTWSLNESGLISITYKILGFKNRESNTIIERNYQIIEFSNTNLVLKLIGQKDKQYFIAEPKLN